MYWNRTEPNRNFVHFQFDLVFSLDNEKLTEVLNIYKMRIYANVKCSQRNAYRINGHELSRNHILLDNNSYQFGSLMKKAANFVQKLQTIRWQTRESANDELQRSVAFNRDEDHLFSSSKLKRQTSGDMIITGYRKWCRVSLLWKKRKQTPPWLQRVGLWWLPPQ